MDGGGDPEVAGDPALGARLGENARRLVEERFTWTHAATALVGVYQSVLQPMSSTVGPAISKCHTVLVRRVDCLWRPGTDRSVH